MLALIIQYYRKRIVQYIILWRSRLGKDKSEVNKKMLKDIRDRRRVNFERGCRIECQRGTKHNIQKIFLSAFIYRLNKHL